MTTNLFGAQWTPTNTTGIGSYTNGAQYWQSFAVTGVGHYVATMIDTNPIPANTPLAGPATVTIHLYLNSGVPSGNYGFSAKPELYYIYDLSTNALTLGDFDANPQVFTAGVTNEKMFTIAWPTVTPTQNYYRVFRLRCTAKGSATTNVVMGIGGTDASFVQLQQTASEYTLTAAGIAAAGGLTNPASDFATAAQGVTATNVSALLISHTNAQGAAAHLGLMTNGQTAANSLMLGGLSAANYYQSQQANEKVNTNDTRYLAAVTNNQTGVTLGGSFTATGGNVVTGGQVIASATNANFATWAGSATNANLSTWAMSSTNARTAMNATNAQLATWAGSATNANLATWAMSSTNAQWAMNATNAQLATWAGSATNANLATWAKSSTNAQWAMNATNAQLATWAGSATNANYATVSATASNLVGAQSNTLAMAVTTNLTEFFAAPFEWTNLVVNTSNLTLGLVWASTNTYYYRFANTGAVTIAPSGWPSGRYAEMVISLSCASNVNFILPTNAPRFANGTWTYAAPSIRTNALLFFVHSPHEYWYMAGTNDPPIGTP
jgi:hypothetical protein